MGLTSFPGFPGDREALQFFEDSQGNEYIRVYPWQGINAVLGRTTHEQPDLDLPACREDDIEIYRRKGGGGAVMLMPGVLVITAGYRKISGPPDLPLVIEGIADRIGEAVRRQHLGDVQRLGMGDICLGNRKILGSSLYQTRDVILYQGSLLLEADLNMISRYLNHPSKEPDYRQGRDHVAFLTTMTREGQVDYMKLIQDLEQLLHGFNIYGEQS